MKFNPEEISLCKQIAEKYRKEIEYGDWYLDNTVVLLNNNFITGTIHEARQVRLCLIPIWTISDCLEFLRGKGYRLSGHYELKNEVLVSFSAETASAMDIIPEIYNQGKTDLVAFLKVVLTLLNTKEE